MATKKQPTKAKSKSTKKRVQQAHRHTEPGVSYQAVQFAIEHRDLKAAEYKEAAQKAMPKAAVATVMSWRTAAQLVCRVLVDLSLMKPMEGHDTDHLQGDHS